MLDNFNFLLQGQIHPAFLVVSHSYSNHAAAASLTRARYTRDPESFIRGYHAYINTWTPVEDEMLRLIPEPTISLFLRRDVNKAFAGGRVNRGAGCGL